MKKQQSERISDISEDSIPEFYHRFDEYTQEDRRRARFCTTSRLEWFCPYRKPQPKITNAPPAVKSHGAASNSVPSRKSLPRQQKPLFHIKYPDSCRLFGKSTSKAPTAKQLASNLKESGRKKLPGNLFSGLTNSADEIRNGEYDGLKNGRIDREGFRELMRRNRSKEKE